MANKKRKNTTTFTYSHGITGCVQKPQDIKKIQDHFLKDKYLKNHTLSTPHQIQSKAQYFNEIQKECQERCECTEKHRRNSKVRAFWTSLVHTCYMNIPYLQTISRSEYRHINEIMRCEINRCQWKKEGGWDEGMKD